jgi:atypical dual specificity phosphatase
MSSSLPLEFSWIDQDRVAGCRGPRSDSDLAFLVSKGIRALVRLAYEEETGMTKENVRGHAIEDWYEPIVDFTAPSQEQIDRVLKFMRYALQQGKPVAVSCNAGHGRTGTMLACYLVSLGQTADQALAQLLSIRPSSKELLKVRPQKEAIDEFAIRLRKKTPSI